MKPGILILTLFIPVAIAVSHDPLDTDTTTDSDISVDYETVTQIIKALKSRPEAEETSTEDEQGQDYQDSEDGKHSYEKYVYEHFPEEVFQKRKHAVGKSHRKPLYYVDEIEDLDSDDVILEEPCDVEFEEDNVHDHNVHVGGENPGYVGSLRGTPGVDYPNYSEIPLTSFTCADKKRIPGFYADVETKCQVFHVCYPHRRESFLCPTGTTFNQPILACDYWYNYNCSTASSYFEIDEEEEFEYPEIPEEIEEEFVTIEEFPEVPVTEPPEQAYTIVVEEAYPLPPVEIPEPEEPKLIPPVIEVHQFKPVPKPKVVVSPKAPVLDIATLAKFLPVKAKVTKFAVPIKAKVVKAKVAKIKAAKLAPIKAKMMVAKAVPVAKLVKAAAAKNLLGQKILVKTKLAAPVVKPLVIKKAIVAKKLMLTKAAKLAKLKAAKAFPAVSALTKKHLILSLLKMKAGKVHPGFGPVYYRY